MPNKTIYIRDSDADFWKEAEALATRRGGSLSGVLADLVRRYVRDERTDTGLPVGFKVPASMKDPKVLAREQFADDVRAKVLELLEIGPKEQAS
jgi:hypothetical protein